MLFSLLLVPQMAAHHICVCHQHLPTQSRSQCLKTHSTTESISGTKLIKTSLPLWISFGAELFKPFSKERIGVGGGGHMATEGGGSCSRTRVVRVERRKWGHCFPEFRRRLWALHHQHPGTKAVDPQSQIKPKQEMMAEIHNELS